MISRDCLQQSSLMAYKNVYQLLGVAFIVGLASGRALKADEDASPRIGIIGGGIGGTSTAFFLRQLYGPKLTIDVFEAQKVGGRTSLIRVNGEDYEAGGTIIHKKNIIYEFQDKGMAFTTTEDMLRAMGDDLLNMTRHTMNESLQHIGLSQRFIDEFAAAAVKDNYGQTLNAHGFLGVVSLMAVEPDLWAIQDGNKRMAELLLRESKANLIKGSVNTVALIKDNLGTGSVSYELDYTKATPGSDKETSESREYDIVVVAAPLNEGSKNKISFADFPRDVVTFKQDYHKLISMFVQGKVNTTAFDVGSQNELPAEIISIAPGCFFNSLKKMTPVSPNSKPDTPLKPEEAVWRVFFNKDPTEEEINNLFVSHSDLRLVDWWAYPEYQAGADLPPFMLYDRLYYVNAVEAAASAMETALIGGRNVALLAYNQWHGHFDKIDEVQLPSPAENEETKKSEL
ncbi:prenylcysteine oxidase [Elysia marginata]|uniref:Prenylcysteine oxidase n=1 Tax=Elysia marginata TaxID=1093978 RepID=A0AAV4GDX5_9GAST|nr:prenylcysteine oxidase [Elysia marginata]